MTLGTYKARWAMRAAILAGALGNLWCQSPQETSGAIHGVVFVAAENGNRSFVPNTSVTLSGPSVTRVAVSDESGHYSFASVPLGTYRLDAQGPGLRGTAIAELAENAVIDIPVELKPEAAQESVTVTAEEAPPLAADSSNQSVLGRSTVLNAPNKEEKIDALLPLVPGVVRGPDGLINMKGARSGQAGYLVNSANVTDPVTGSSAMSLPIDVVESVKVISDPYDPEYGRLTGAVASVETVTGNFNAFRINVQNIMPRPGKRDGDFVGIESSTPRITLTGPVLKNKIAFTQSLEYRFIRTPVESLPPLQRDMKVESVNAYSQADVNLSGRQTMTLSFALYPQKLNYLGLNTFVPQPSTPDLHQRGYMLSLQHRYTLSADSLVVSQFSYKRFDADVTANSTDPYKLLVETTEGGFFDLQRRQTYRTEWQETWRLTKYGFLGSHQLKFGTDFAHSSYDGRIQMRPVAIVGVSNLPLENIDFGPVSVFDIHQNEFAWFAGDKWSPFRRLTLDLGLRFDRDSITRNTNVAPRVGVALSLTNDSKTLLKGGAGLFYDKIPLDAASFPLLPERTVETLSPDGEVLESVPYINTVTGHLRNPRSMAWNTELDREVTSGLILKAAFQERNTVRDFVIDPELISPNQGLLSLSSDGHSIYRELQVAGQYKLRRDTVNASYVRSRAWGDLNDFNQFFGNNAYAVIEPNERGRLPFDAPNRVLVWGQFEMPLKLTVTPDLDVHTGFPYSATDQWRDFVGPRDSQRLPWFSSLDVQITREFPLPFRRHDLKARIGVSVFNVLNHFNPRDVQSDIDSYRYGALFNGVGRTFRGKFIFEF